MQQEVMTAQPLPERHVSNQTVQHQGHAVSQVLQCPVFRRDLFFFELSLGTRTSGRGSFDLSSQCFCLLWACGAQGVQLSEASMSSMERQLEQGGPLPHVKPTLRRR